MEIQQILGVILCLVEFEVFNNSAAYITEALKQAASFIIQFCPAVCRIAANRLLNHPGQSLLEDTGSIGLLVNKIIEFEPGVRIVGIKNVTMNEPFFQGHFEGLPVMPGVLILEAMAQAGGIMLLNQASNPDDKIVYITGLDNVRFRRPVIPGDQLRFEMEFIRMKRSTCKWAGKVFVENKLVAEAQLMASIVDR